MSKMLQILLLGSALLGGCMWSRATINDPTILERARLIKVGVTRGEEVPGLLAAQPTMRLPGEEVNVYGYAYGETKSHGLVLIICNFSRSSVVSETLYVEVDAKTDLVRRVYIPPVRETEWRFWPFGD